MSQDSGSQAGSPEVAFSGISSEILGDFDMELKRIRDELRAVRTEFQAFRQEMAEIRDLAGRVDGIESRLTVLEQCNKNVTPSSDISDVVLQLKRDLNDRDQELLANDLEITNVPETSGESLTHIVKLVTNKFGISLEDRDLVSVDRVGGRIINSLNPSGPSESKPRHIVVRLARRDLRDSILREARVRRGANTADLDVPGSPRRFYINERLTKSNRSLFRQARDAGQQCGWKFVWTSRGRILARQNPGDTVSRIRCEEDIKRVFGSRISDA